MPGECPVCGRFYRYVDGRTDRTIYVHTGGLGHAPPGPEDCVTSGGAVVQVGWPDAWVADSTVDALDCQDCDGQAVVVTEDGVPFCRDCGLVALEVRQHRARVA